MKIGKMIRTPIVFAVLALFLTASIGSAKDSDQKTPLKQAQEEVAEAARAIKNYSVNQRDEAINKVKKSLDALDARIDRLQASIDKKWDRMSEASREKARATMKQLREQRNQVAEWYGGMKHSSARAWDQMKKGFSDAYQSLYDSWKKAADQFKSDKTGKDGV
ncbi:MAG: hypothetical protein P8165_02720 [Deltaproteobacteria bacterium]